MTNLFGEDEPLKIRRRGHAALPGTGPEGQTCKTCKHLCYVETAKRYYKCDLMEHLWTAGPGSDVRCKDPACSRWEPET